MFTAKYIKDSFSPFSNQKEFIKLMIHKRRCLLSDRTGSGKTCTTLYSFAYLLEKQTLKNMVVLMPLNAYEKKVWVKDITKFFNLTYIDLEDLIKQVKTNPANLQKLLDHYNVILCKHTHVKQDIPFQILGNICTRSTTLLCVDEIHYFRNPKSSLTIRMKAISKPCRAFWGITATTISRNIENLYHLIDLVYPWYLGTWIMFRDTYCNTMQRCVGTFNGHRRMVTETTTLKDPVGLQKKLDPILLSGESFFTLHHHYIDYNLDEYEQKIYTKIANGITCEPSEEDPEQWFRALMSDTLKEPSARLGDVERWSNRFVFLQYAADGIVSVDGSYTRKDTTKFSLLADLCNSVIDKHQSILVYFDYYEPLKAAHAYLNEHLHSCTILESTGDHKLKDGDVTEAKCKQRSHIILCTRASSESVSYYFINHVAFFHNPTIPSTAIQMCGRITRKNSLYPDDLHVYWFRSDNIDLYKLCVVSGKAWLMEQSSGITDNNIPEDYKVTMSKADAQERAKRLLLWQK